MRMVRTVGRKLVEPFPLVEVGYPFDGEARKWDEQEQVGRSGRFGVDG